MYYLLHILSRFDHCLNEMKATMVEEATAGFYHDEDNKPFYEQESLNADRIGYIAFFMTFMLIVLLVCITGITVTSRWCRGREVKFSSNNYENNTEVAGGINGDYLEGGGIRIEHTFLESELSESRV